MSLHWHGLLTLITDTYSGLPSVAVGFLLHHGCNIEALKPGEISRIFPVYSWQVETRLCPNPTLQPPRLALVTFRLVQDLQDATRTHIIRKKVVQAG